MVPDPAGNVVLHVAEWMPEGVGMAMPSAVCAADLAASLDARERRAGLSALEEMLDGYSRSLDPNARTLAAIDDAAAGRVTGPFSSVGDMLASLDEDER